MSKKQKTVGVFCLLLLLSLWFGWAEQASAFGLKFAREHSSMSTAYVEDLTKGEMFVQENGESQGGVTHYYKVSTNSKHASLYFFTHNTRPLEVSVLNANGVKLMDVPVIQANIGNFKMATGDYDTDAIFASAASGVVLKPNTTYYIKVDVESSYRYLYAFDQYQDNNNKDFGSAKTMSVDLASQVGTAQTNNAEFFYKFQTKKGNYFYRFNMANTSATSADPRLAEVYLYDKNKQLVAKGQGSSRTVMAGPWKLNQNQTYYARVVCAKKGSHFSLSITSFNDEAADTMLAAGVIAPKKDYIYRIQNDADVDWIKFKTTTQKQYKVFCKAGSGIQIQLKDAKGKTVTKITKNTTVSLKTNAVYYFKIFGASGSSCRLSYEQVKAAATKKYISVKKITLNKKTLKLKKGKTYTLKIKKVTPSNASKKSVKFTSSKKKIVKIVKGGKIKALKKGKSVITCTYTAKDKTKKKATCKVTVK